MPFVVASKLNDLVLIADVVGIMCVDRRGENRVKTAYDY